MSFNFENINYALELATAAGVIVAIIGALITWHQWKKNQERLSAEFLEKLIKDFESDCLFCLLRVSDDRESLAIDLMKDEGINLVYRFLQKCNHLCYLQKKKLIKQAEFKHFEPILERFLQNDVIANAIKSETIDLHLYDNFSCYVSTHYPLLLEHKDEKVNLVDSTSQQECVGEDLKAEQVVVKNNEELLVEDLIEPTMLIKINRLYREGMSDSELYEVTRKWWKIRIERASTMKYALAVVNGTVREVFTIVKWQKDTDVGENYDGRICFEGFVAESSVRERFINKSVAHLFPKGAANPIRYFG